MIKYAFLSLVGVILALAGYLYVHLGIGMPVDIEVVERGPLQMIYKEHRGAYHEIVPVINEVEKWVNDQGLRCLQTFGEYLDDPNAVDQDRLRSHGGCILGVKMADLPDGFHFEERERRSYVVAHFSGSPAVSPFTVYPKVKAFIERERIKTLGAVIEIYTVEGDKVHTEYLF